MGEYFGLFFSYKMTLMFFYYYLKCVCCCRKHPSQGKDMGIAGAQGLFLLCVQMRQEVRFLQKSCPGSTSKYPNP